MSKHPLPTNAPTVSQPSPGVSRRSLMRGAALVGAAGVAVVVTPGAAAAMAAPSTRSSVEAPTGSGSMEHTEPLVVHLRDARTGELDVFAGERHHRVVDRRLAEAIVHALG